MSQSVQPFDLRPLAPSALELDPVRLDGARVPAPKPWASRSRRLLRQDGAFLVVVGLVQVVSELLSHYGSKGIHGDTFADSAYTIGFVEAHGLAAMIGVTLVWSATQADRRFFHKFAIAVHLFLGAANVIFWHSFQEQDFVAAGVVGTLAHIVFIGRQRACLASLRNEQTEGVTR